MAADVLLLALTVPRVLNPFNVLWSRFGLLLHLVVSPVIMALMFFVVITPIALVMRLLGKRPLSLPKPTGSTGFRRGRLPLP